MQEKGRKGAKKKLKAEWFAKGKKCGMNRRNVTGDNLTKKDSKV